MVTSGAKARGGQPPSPRKSSQSRYGDSNGGAGTREPRVCAPQRAALCPPQGALCPGQGGLLGPGDTPLSPFLTSLTVTRAGQVMTGLTGLYFCLMVSCPKQGKTPRPHLQCTEHPAQRNRTRFQGQSRRRGHRQTLEISDNFLPISLPRGPLPHPAGAVPQGSFWTAPSRAAQIHTQAAPKGLLGFQ